MSWKYTLFSNRATHVETGETFGIEYISQKSKDDLDFELVPPPSDSAKILWSAPELERLKQELRIAMREEFEQAELRAKLATLVKNPLIGDHYQAADVISTVSGKSVSQRSIQSWLIEPDKRSSRKCPAWAVNALESYLAEPENQKRLRDWLSYYKASSAAASQPADTGAPPPAPRPTAEQTRQQEWQNASLAELPGLLAAMEQRMEACIKHFSETLEAITSTLVDEGKDLDDIKRSLRLKLMDLRQTGFMLEDPGARANPPRDDGDDFG